MSFCARRVGVVALLLCPFTARGAEKPRPTPTPSVSVPANTETPAAMREWREGGELVRAYVSSPRPNGVAGAFSAWWAIESPQPPEGWVLKSVSFHLVGDRFCAGTDASPVGAGTSAECRQDLRNDRVARWAFRTQGHDDGIDPEKWSMGFSVPAGQVVTSGPAGTSRGVLLCTYAPAPPPTPTATK